jgi:two-component system LytT family response regulator
MKKISTLIVDDEPLAREGLETMLVPDQDLEIIGFCADGQSALETIRVRRPDLVFLDVQMPKRDGFGVLAELKPHERPVVIFATAYDQHAIQAFEVNAVDYLLKPFSDARVGTALARAKDEIRKARTSDLSRQVEQLLSYVRELDAKPNPAEPAATPKLHASEEADRIVLKADGALHFIKTRDIIWIEAQGDFVKVQTPGKTQLVRETMQSMEEKLDGSKFLRIHRSFLVNLDHVRKVEVALYGDYSVSMSDGSKLRLSRNYRSKLKALLKQRPAV